MPYHIKRNYPHLTIISYLELCMWIKKNLGIQYYKAGFTTLPSTMSYPKVEFGPT